MGRAIAFLFSCQAATEITSVFMDEGTYAYSKTPNKILMFVTLDSNKWIADPAQAFVMTALTVYGCG